MKIKKLILILLPVIIVIVAVPFILKAVNGNKTENPDETTATTTAPDKTENNTVVDSGTCGDNLTWALDSEGILTISGTGEMTDYNFSESPWYQNYKIKSLVINSGITDIGSYSFEECKCLTSVTIPGSVTSVGDFAFYNCKGLTIVTIGNGVASIGKDAFSCCTGLTSITIPDGVTEIGDMAFSNCENLKNITIPDSVVSIGHNAFSGCSNLNSITIPDSVKNIGEEAFSFTEYYNDDSNWSDGVLYIGKHLIKAEASLSGHYSVKDGTLTIASGAFAGNDFAYCTNLTSVTIPDSVTNIGYSAFFGCESLKDVYYSGSEEDRNNIEIGEGNEYLTGAEIHFNSAT